MNILGIVNDSDRRTMDAVQYYRAFLPLREVNRNAEGIDATVIDQDGIRKVSDECRDADLWDGRDVYAMCRMYHEDCEEFIAEIHRRDAVLVLDSDDDLTEDYRLVGGRGDEFKKALGLVDYVTVSTPALAAHLGQYTRKPPVVLRNHVDTAWMVEIAGKAKRVIDGLTMGFIGSPTHWGDWYLPSVPFARVVRELGVTPVLCGDALPRYLEHTGMDLVRFGSVPFAAYPIVFKQLDIVLCAVDSEDEFNTGKSAVKALEAMAIGVVPVCSRFQPYIDLQGAGAPIVLIDEDNRDGWYETLRALVTHDDYRLALSAAGPGWVRENRDMCVSGWKAWEQFYSEVADRTR